MRLPPRLTDPVAASLLARMSAVEWRLLREPAETGRRNMERDEALLAAAAREALPPTLRFYAWNPPAVSLGRFQDAEGINREYAAQRGWDVVRRPTGGRGVLHQFEVTYSITLPPSVVGGSGVRAGYAVLVGALNAGLRELLGASPETPEPTSERCGPRSRRAANCFALAAECDTLAPGGKLVGSAQVRRGGALLQHGSILLDLEPEAWTALFGDPGRPVSLRGLLGTAPAREEVEQAVIAGFERWGIRFGHPEG